MDKILSGAKKISVYDLLAISIGIVYLWFGALKFIPGVSPAERLAENTIDALFFGLIPSNVSVILLAVWEVLIGILLILNVYKRFGIILALIHMGFTFTPLFLFPDLSFTHPPFEFTIIGQYIVKNLIIVCALLILLKEAPTKV
ncbi:MAG: doxx family protein [Flavobacteriaceae bacterium]|nr:doxx family protein [Flavobacteriaceae bacterium]